MHQSAPQSSRLGQMIFTPTQAVSQFTIPQPTPRTESSSKQVPTPQKFKSPNSAVKDLTTHMESLDSSMKSPPKEILSTTINPQSGVGLKKK